MGMKVTIEMIHRIVDDIVLLCGCVKRILYIAVHDHDNVMVYDES
jgi:hypothetical protein